MKNPLKKTNKRIVKMLEKMRDKQEKATKKKKDSRISKETSANDERYPLFCDEKSSNSVF